MGTDLFGAGGGSDSAGAEARFAGPLTIAGVKPLEGGVVTIDDYVRFTFESPAGTAGTGTVAIEDGDLALVEIGVDLATGRLRGATLVSFARRARALRFDVAGLPATEGLPTFAAPQVADDRLLPRIVRRGAVDLWRGSDLGLMQIAQGEPDRLIRAGDAIVLVAGDMLWGFGADGLDGGDLARMTG